MSLDELEWVSNNIDSVPSKTAKLLYRIIFGENSGRLNRKEIKNFTGFGYSELELNEKVSEVIRIFSLVELAAVCGLLTLDFDGKPEEISKRICGALNDIRDFPKKSIDSDEETQSGECEEEHDSVCNQFSKLSLNADQIDSQAMPNSTSSVPSDIQFVMSYKDIEDSITKYDGSQDVHSWVTEFEQSAQLYGWSEIQKVIFTKKSLSGLAKLHVKSQPGLDSWSKLKTSLLKEFGHKLNSAQIHQLLSRKRQREDEGVEEYFLHMKNLGMHGNIEEESLIYYIVEGIRDTPYNKAILFDALTLADFKENLKRYKRVKGRSDSNTTVN